MKKKAKLIFICFIISPLVLSSILFYAGDFNSTPASKSKITFMTYNIHFGQGMDDILNLERIAQNILICDPDIIALQEVEPGRVTSQGVDMAFWLATRLRMYYYYYNPKNNPHVMGNAILSKYPIISANGYEIPSILQERVFIHCVIQVGPSLLLDVFNTHLGIRDENEYVQVNYLLNKLFELATPSYPKILMGDFNLQRTSPEIRPILNYFTDTGSIVSSSKRASIDYIFVRGQLKVVEYQVITDMIPNIETPAEYGSDHLPVCSEIQF